MDAVNSHMNEVFRTVRNGDLKTLRLLLDEDGIELNIRDEWDSTPLYYACLCGHEDIVEFLLQNGVKCEANTFDAERCFYAALTQEIKNILREYKTVSGEHFKRDLYQDFFRRCIERCHFADIWFRVGNEIISAHRIILSARCSYFATMLLSKWKDRKFVSLKRNTVSASSFRSFISYLYIGSVDIPLSDVQDFIAISKKCQMHHLSANVEKAMRNFHYYADTKPVAMRNRISLISIGDEKDFEDIKGSFASLVELCIPHPLRFKQCYGAVPDIFSISLDDGCVHTGQMVYNEAPYFIDVCLIVQGHEFNCHKVFLCNRSDYFRALIHFTEAEAANSKDSVFISLNDISPEAFAAVLNFIYSDNCKIFPENVYEILYFSDLFLLPGLKNKCATLLFQELTPENVVYTLKLARMYGLNRLEFQCANFIAVKLPEVVYTKEFLELIKHDASMIQRREETDTIQIIDDIRHHLLKLALPGIYSDSTNIDVQDRFDMLDSVLKTLGLEA